MVWTHYLNFIVHFNYNSSMCSRSAKYGSRPPRRELLKPFKYMYAVSKTCFEDSISVITLRIPDTTSLPHSSGDPILSARGQAGFRIALSMWAEWVLLDWISDNSLWYSFQLTSAVGVSSSQLKCRCFFIVSVDVASDCGSPETKDGFYGVLSITPKCVFNGNCDDRRWF